MATFLPIGHAIDYSEQKEQANREKYVFYCSVDYTSRQINLYRMFFTDFSVNSQPIFIKFCKDYREIFIKKLFGM